MEEKYHVQLVLVLVHRARGGAAGLVVQFAVVRGPRQKISHFADGPFHKRNLGISMMRMVCAATKILTVASKKTSPSGADQNVEMNTPLGSK